MKRLLYTILLSMTIVPMIGCHSKVRAPKLSDGQSYQVMVLFDRGINDTLTERQVQLRHEVGGFMENNLVRTLNRSGYKAQLIKDRGEYVSGKGAFLLPVKIVSYNPGSQAARIMVGFGVGAASLNIHYELIDNENKTLISQPDGVGSSQGWRQCVNKLDHNIVKAVTQKLQEKK